MVCACDLFLPALPVEPNIQDYGVIPNYHALTISNPSPKILPL